MQILLPDRPLLTDLYLLDLYFVYNTKTFDAFHMLIQTYAFNVFTNFDFEMTKETSTLVTKNKIEL